MTHTCGIGAGTLCRQCEENELSGQAVKAAVVGGVRICRNCGEQLDQGWAENYCPECERRESEERAEEISFGSGALLAVLLLCLPAFGQTVYSGRGVASGYGVSGAMRFGALLTYPARTDTCETGAEPGCVANPLCPSCTGTGQPLTWLGPSTPSTLPAAGPSGSVSCGSLGTITQPLNGQYPCGINTVITDPDLGTKMVRATDYSMAAAGLSWSMGSAGALHLWSSDSKKVLLQNVGSGTQMLSFNANHSNPQVTASAIYGNAIVPGTNAYAFSFVTPNVMWEVDQEQASTVAGLLTSGTCATRETMTQTTTGAHGTLITLNAASFQIGNTTGGTPDASHTWVGQTSSCVFTPSAVPTTLAYINQLNKLTINDSGAPSTWTLTRSKVFNFNWDGSTDGTSSQNCLPANYKTTWTGMFVPSYDDSSFTMSWSDDGQNGLPGGTCANSPGGVCTGGVYLTNYTVSHGGCRMLNFLTGQIIGDWGPTGYAVNGQVTANSGAGSLCNWANPCTGTALLDASTVPFTDFDNLHEGINMPQAAYAGVGAVEQPQGQVSSVQSDGSGHTTITLTTNTKGYPAGQRVYFYGLTNSNNTWLNCTPTTLPCTSTPWTVTQGVSSYQFIIADGGHAAGGPYTESNPSATNSAVAGSCLTGDKQSAICGMYYWHIPTLTIEPCLSNTCQGHGAQGYVNTYIAKWYTAHTVTNPSLPCSISGSVPCPATYEYKLLPMTVFDDQHGMPNNAGTQDLSPPGFITSFVCGQAPPGGSYACPGTPTASHGYTVWNDEIIAIENWVTRAPSGADCNYSAIGGPSATGCVYRLGRTFNSGDDSNFNAQNAVGNISPDGNWAAFPSDFGHTLGCTDGTTNCWSSYIASVPPNASMTGATVQTDGSSNLTVTMSNKFCSPGGSQYYWVTDHVESIACGTMPEQITLTGFNESWANQTITLTAVSGCDSTDSNAGTCTSFTGTGSGIPANYGPVTETGTQTAKPPATCGASTLSTQPCQRADIWIADLTSAHQ